MAKSKSKKNSSLPPDSVLAEAGAEAQALEGLKHRPTHVKRQLRVDLTLEEKAVLSDQLAQAVENLHNAENDKAEELSQYNADIKAHRASITKLAQQINLGYQMTEVECPVKYNEPKVGQKSVLHPKTGTVLATEAMAEEERQENLFDDENPEARGKKAAETLAEFKGKGKDKTQPATTTDAEKAPVN
jgi:hypothetical protein